MKRGKNGLGYDEGFRSPTMKKHHEVKLLPKKNVHIEILRSLSCSSNKAFEDCYAERKKQIYLLHREYKENSEWVIKKKDTRK